MKKAVRNKKKLNGYFLELENNQFREIAIAIRGNIPEPSNKDFTYFFDVQAVIKPHRAQSAAD